jgi:hypothetical protein
MNNTFPDIIEHKHTSSPLKKIVLPPAIGTNQSFIFYGVHTHPAIPASTSSYPGNLIQASLAGIVSLLPVRRFTTNRTVSREKNIQDFIPGPLPYFHDSPGS